MVCGDLASPRVQNYLDCWSLTVVPADCPELLGWYAITILVFLVPEPSCIQHHHPRLVESTPELTTSGDIIPNAIIAHPLNQFVLILLFTLCATTLLVSDPQPNRL